MSMFREHVCTLEKGLYLSIIRGEFLSRVQYDVEHDFNVFNLKVWEV